MSTAIQRALGFSENWQSSVDMGLFAPNTRPDQILTGKDMVELLLHIVGPL